jgi:hypothetical protein
VRTNARIQVLKELVSTSQYVVDPAAVAEAIIARSVARHFLLQHAERPAGALVSPASRRAVAPVDRPERHPGDEQDSSRVR